MLKHSRDWNLVREVVLGSRLSPETPAYDIQQACGTGLRPRSSSPTRSASADPVGDRRRRRHDVRRADRDRPQAPQEAAERQPSEGPAEPPQGAREDPPGRHHPSTPGQQGAAHGQVDGWPHRRVGRQVGHHPRGSGPAHAREPREAERRLRAWASSTTSSPPTRAWSATRTCAPAARSRSSASCAGVRRRRDGTMTAANSTRSRTAPPWCSSAPTSGRRSTASRSSRTSSTARLPPWIT